MRIGGKGVYPGGDSGELKGKQAKGRASSGSCGQDSVGFKLGIKAQKVIDDLKLRLVNLPECDSKKVEALKTQILKGSYKIDFRSVAEHMLETMRVSPCS